MIKAKFELKMFDITRNSSKIETCKFAVEYILEIVNLRGFIDYRLHNNSDLWIHLRSDVSEIKKFEIELDFENVDFTPTISYRIISNLYKEIGKVAFNEIIKIKNLRDFDKLLLDSEIRRIEMQFNIVE